MEAARRRESAEVGSSATPRALPSVSRPITAMDRNTLPSTDEDRTAAAPAASSSGGGGGTYLIEERKRKCDDSDDSDAEDADYDSESKYKANPRSKRRTRSAEVHNLSERRRRDRINEKMKALQQLIPHCSKTDKASMLDDAVEYMKSLQLQIQMMGGMASTTFPCIPQHTPPLGMAMSGMGMETNLGNLVPRVWPFSPFVIGSAIPNSVQSQATMPMPAYIPTMLAVNGQLPCQPVIPRVPSVVNFQGFNPALRPAIPDPCNQFVGLHHMQIPQQNQTSAEQAGYRGSNFVKSDNPKHDQ